MPDKFAYTVATPFEPVSSACIHCHMVIVLRDGKWTHLIGGNVECSDLPPLGFGKPQRDRI